LLLTRRRAARCGPLDTVARLAAAAYVGVRGFGGRSGARSGARSGRRGGDRRRLLRELLFEPGVPSVLVSVVCAPGQQLGNGCEEQWDSVPHFVRGWNGILEGCMLGVTVCSGDRIHLAGEGAAGAAGVHFCGKHMGSKPEWQGGLTRPFVAEHFVRLQGGGMGGVGIGARE
jgi:hypothetical protein